MSKLIAEAVSFMHPDKICDQFSDLLLDEYLKQDPRSRVAVECVGGHGHLSLFGEVTSQAQLDAAAVARKYYQALTGEDIEVNSYLSQQSADIAQGVNLGGAGDQGIMIGYACSENKLLLPQEMYLARKLLKGLKVDAKSQVVMNGSKVESVVISVQGKEQKELVDYVLNLGINVDKNHIYANQTGKFELGGFEADSGCTGRKIVVDAYGPRVPVGGGAFSGKDPSKVDRSSAYMARWIAIQLLHEYDAKETLVRLGYVIGKAEPLMKQAVVDGKEINLAYDCRPTAIIERFDLLRPIYLDTAKNGHFGRKELPWEKLS